MYCEKCGSKLNGSYCTRCGYNSATHVQTNSPGNTIRKQAYDDGGTGLCLIGFCFPLIGLVLYLIWRDSKPLSAHLAGKGALISFVIGLAINILYFLFVLMTGVAA